MSKQDSIRTVSLSGLKIIQLRRQRLWSQEILGEKAHLSLRTIANAELGKPLLLASANAIAAALSVDIETLLSDQSPSRKCQSGPAPHLCAFRDGEMLTAARMNQIIDAINAREVMSDKQSLPLAKFYNGQVLTADILNAIVDRLTQG